MRLLVVIIIFAVIFRAFYHGMERMLNSPLTSKKKKEEKDLKDAPKKA